MIRIIVLLLLITPTTFAADYVSGTIVDNNLHPLAGVKLTFTSSATTRVVTSDAQGNYRFTGGCAPVGDPVFTLTPFLANYSFTPPSAIIFVIPCSSSASQQTFFGTLGNLTASPLDTPEFFVRQQYVDLLKREPDEYGLGFWSSILGACTTQACRNFERRHLMCAFIASGEYQARFTGVPVTVCE